jgi:hypothetical protein
VSARALGAAVAAVAVAAVVAVVLVSTRGGADEQEPLLPSGQALDVTGTIGPGVTLFGDTLTARVDAIVDRRRIDPDALELKASFAPYEQVSDLKVERRDFGHESRVTFSTSLRCDEFACLVAAPTAPTGGEVPTRRPFRLEPARLSVRGTQIATAVPWRPIEVTSRVNESEPGGIRYRANVSPLPEPTYRISPHVLAGIAFALAAALALLGAALVARAVRTLSTPRRPELDLPPVERALWLLDWTRDRGDGESRRRALERLADALERERHVELAGAIRAVAWSHESPTPEDAETLSDRVTTERRSNGHSR